MGREAITTATIGSETGEVRVLLESAELILRGTIRRRFPRAALEQVRVEGDALRFDCAGEAVRLDLGAAVAAAWAKAIATPPPSLRAKLGLDEGARAFRLGAAGDAALDEALAGVTVGDIAAAGMIVALVETAGDLAAAVAMQATRPALALWAIYPKGAGVPFGDSAIRTSLRAAGFRDSKSCAVSERLTATRYGRV